MDELLTLFETALKIFYKQDLDLLKREVHERSIAFRVGLYFHDLLRSSKYAALDLDLEYNRNKKDRKRTQSSPHSTYPDLILHKRNSNEQNVLVVEFKISRNPRPTNRTRDIEKLKDFTSSSQQYGYQLGISVLLKREDPVFTILQNGEVTIPLTKTLSQIGDRILI